MHIAPLPSVHPGTEVLLDAGAGFSSTLFPVALVTLVIGMKPQTLSSTATDYSAGCVSTWHKGHHKLVMMRKWWDR